MNKTDEELLAIIDDCTKHMFSCFTDEHVYFDGKLYTIWLIMEAAGYNEYIQNIKTATELRIAYRKAMANNDNNENVLKKDLLTALKDNPELLDDYK